MYRSRTIFLVLLWAAPLLGAPKEVAVRWEELAPLVEKRQIETVLTNGVHIRGRVEQALYFFFSRFHSSRDRARPQNGQ